MVIEHSGEVAGGGADTVRFTDLRLSDMTISIYTHPSANGDALKFFWAADGDRPEGQFHIANRADQVERFEFADGTSFTAISVQSNGSLELVGTSGNDRISGSTAVDHLTGGAGNDSFVFTETSGNDHVTDFTDGEDLIRIEGGTFDFADLVLEASGANALVRFGSTVVTLEGVLLTDLDQGDFLFT